MPNDEFDSDEVINPDEIESVKQDDLEKDNEFNLAPGTVHMIRYLFIKGFYYHDAQAMITCAEMVMPLSVDPIPLKEKIDILIGMMSEIELTERNLKESNLNYIYISNLDKRNLLKKIYEIKTKFGIERQFLVKNIINIMQDKRLLDKAITIYQIQKLPLKFGDTDDEEDYHYGE